MKTNELTFALRRNAACPCGSEEKFKKCCEGNLEKWQEQYYALLQAESAIKHKITEILFQDCGADVVNKMIAAFTGGPPLETDNLPSFFEWLWFEAKNPEGHRGWLNGLVENHKSEFTQEELLILNDWINNTQAGVFEIIGSNSKEWCSTLREIVSGKEYTVRDRKLTNMAIKGDLFLIRIQRIFGEDYCSGAVRRYDRFAYFDKLKNFIAHSYKKEQEKNKLLSYEEFMNVHAKTFYEFQLPPPIFFANDGTKAQICERAYKIKTDSAQTILDWLSAQKNTIVTDVKKKKGQVCYAHASFVIKERKCPKTSDDDSKVISGSFLMNPSGEQLPCIGDVTLENDTLIFTSLSVKAFGQIASKIDTELQQCVTLDKETIQNPEDALEDREDFSEDDEDEEDIPLEIPKKIMEEYYLNWCSTKIPALENKTPKQAVKTKEGRQQLKELLLSMENHERHRAKQQGFYVPVEAIIRKELNFNEE